MIARCTVRWLAPALILFAISEHLEAADTPRSEDGASASLWVRRSDGSKPSPLRSEVAINGQSIGVFTSDDSKEIGKHLKTGWNTITLKTTPQQRSGAENDLRFSIGDASRDAKTGKQVMQPVLWEFRNGADWQVQDGKLTRRSGRSDQEVTVSYRVYFGGFDLETTRVDDGDYVLQGEPNDNSASSAIPVTVYVNGSPLNSFLGQKRQVVITPLLKEGKNELKIVASHVDNAQTSQSKADSDVTIEVIGPLQYNAGSKRFEGTPIVESKAIHGGQPDTRRDQPADRADRQPATVERSLSFVLDEVPFVAGRMSPERTKR